MGTVIAVSSFVARGSVGLRAIMPALDRTGHETIACPTTFLSNHLGHRHAEGAAIATKTLAAAIAALDANGWLSQADAVLTGYLPSADHVAVVEALIIRVGTLRPGALIVCDAVLGDRPDGLYVPESVAEAVRDRLLPLATHVKANLFELAFLSGRPVETLADVVDAARALGAPAVLASSIPVADDRLANVIVTREEARYCSVIRQSGVPHGTGDLLAALFTAHVLNGTDAATSTALAAGGVASVIASSQGSDELRLFGTLAWHEAPSLAMIETRAV